MSIVSDLLGHLKTTGAATAAELRKASGSTSEASTNTMLSTLRARGMARKRADGKWELGRDPSLPPEPKEDEDEEIAPAPKPPAPARLHASAPVTASGLMRPPANGAITESRPLANPPIPKEPMTRSPNPDLPYAPVSLASKPRTSGDVTLTGDVTGPARGAPIVSMIFNEAIKLEARAARLRKLAQDYLDLEAAP